MSEQLNNDFEIQEDKPPKYKSTLGQSIFNFCNVLMGVGTLSLPLAFKHAGWIIGISLLFFCMGVTNYTARLIIKCLNYKEKIYTYPDIATIAFGNFAKIIILILFSLELIAIAISLVILIGDSLQILFPDISLISLKIIAWMILVPLTLIDIKYLSYFSLLGIVSAIILVFVVIIDGITRNEQPGSLFNPMKTELWPTDWNSLPFSFGLIIAGFAGHSVFPSIYLDMQTPDKYQKAISISYSFSTVVYLLIAVCGYLMFGNMTKPEITQNIMSTPDHLKLLNQFIVWLVAINPFTKIVLELQPVYFYLEIQYQSSSCNLWTRLRNDCFLFIRFLSRMLVTTVVVFFAIKYPQFDRAIELLGSFLFYTISTIIPCMFYLKLYSNNLRWWEWLVNLLIILVCTALAFLGTIWAFLFYE
ncbi:transmembrane amino acid transporter protein [Gigaspora rosea]|uniref:Transmembrane amino acid transporter protein n=1 Tax=Gigaspora rosea TaxID=44941 RepID=A0A397U477_9GLOM|nr:transmembrane amino acid transporter protein [Gigaspora rosea]